MKVKDRAIILRDKGGYITLLPGQTVPKHLEEKITNSSVTRDNRKSKSEEVEAGDEEEFIVEGDGETGASEDDLNNLTVPQLTELAKAEDVDLKGISKKDDIIDAIEAHRADNG